MDVVEIISSQKLKRTGVRGKILVHRGFMYHFHSRNKTGTTFYWRCEQRKICNARCTSNADLENAVIKKSGHNKHTHEPDAVAIDVKKVVNAIKQRARQTPNELPVNIVRDVVEEVTDEEVLMELPDRNLLRRVVNSTQNQERPPVPATLQDIVIAPPYNATKNQFLFLQYDSENNFPGSRFLIYTTEENLRILSTSRLLYGDGTFKTVPQQFMQLYTIHGTFQGHVFPLVYVIMQRKTQDSYTAVLQQLLVIAAEMAIVIAPEHVLTDFEQAAINAFRTVFPAAVLHGCLFHFTQSIWRNTVSRGLRGVYLDRENPERRRQIQQFFGLPFLPLEDLEEVFDSLVEEIEDENILDLATYIEQTYIRGFPARGRRAARPPLYPPPYWNVYPSVLNRMHRTTNVVEGFHSLFQRIISAHHVNIWRFIDQIKKNQHDVEQLIIQIRGGHTQIRHPVSRRYITNQIRVETIVENYATYKEDQTVDVYLRAIGNRLKKPAVENANDE